MAEVHLDHPGDVRWFKGHAPAPVLGDCPHTGCPHEHTGAVAYGPDHAHYVLDACNEPGGCDGTCRGWFGEWPAGHTPHYLPVQRWVHVDVPRKSDAPPASTERNTHRD